VISVLTENNRARTEVCHSSVAEHSGYLKCYTVSGKFAILMFQRIIVPSSAGSSSPRRWETNYPTTQTTQHNVPKKT
jgi:hypothetical protein